jgi:uncharacterized membrane protein
MTIEDSLRINTSPDVVWDVTIDIERWPEWSPTMTSVERIDSGPFRVGSQARIRQPALPEATWTVIQLEPGQRFTWETRVRGIHMVASHAITPDAGATTSTLRIEMRGLPAVLLWPFLRTQVRRALAVENRGLRDRSTTRSTEPRDPV